MLFPNFEGWSVGFSGLQPLIDAMIGAVQPGKVSVCGLRILAVPSADTSIAGNF